MKTIELSQNQSSYREYALPANECVTLVSKPVKGLKVLKQVSVVKGDVWLSFVSSFGKRSLVPLIDVRLHAGQIYRLSGEDLQHGVILSTFDAAMVRISNEMPVTSCHGKSDIPDPDPNTART
jgi:hypothetical protein